ncbi:radical SAM protein [Porticoccaceae bacterium]|nr:radical SAM protein [Porticoccaceae bacterium]
MDTQLKKFSNPLYTASGCSRASVKLKQLKTLWFNTGTLCNLACSHCYIESSPSNDRLEFIRLSQVQQFLDEIQRHDLGTEEIGLTGGEPFLNPDIIAIVGMILRRGFRLLILTNATRPMLKRQAGLLALQKRYGKQLTVRVSIDHFDAQLHQQERGAKSWQPMLDGLCWLSDQGFTIHVAGRRIWGDDEQVLREGYSALFKRHNLKLDAFDKTALVLFPEITVAPDLPEITEECWQILNVDPDAMMCASSRMVVVRRGDWQPSVMACTLLAYDQQFNLGASLIEAQERVQLNHPHCASFCVLGGGTCSVG